MDQIQKALFSITAVILAGVWGYSGDSFALQIKSWVAGVTSSSEQTTEEPSTSENTTTEAVTTPGTSPYQQESPKPLATTPKTVGSTNNAVTSNPTPPANPYAAMSGANLKNSLGTMAPSGETQQRSNAYFDKLSQQLRDLQGENPPPAVEDTEEAEEVAAENPEAPAMESEENPDYATESSDEPLDEVQGEGLEDELEELLIEEGY